MKASLWLSFILCTALCSDVDSLPFGSGSDGMTTPRAEISARQSSIVSFNLGNIGALLAIKGFLLLKALILTPKGINERFAKRSAEGPELRSNPELTIDTWRLDLDIGKEFLHSAETGEVQCLQRLACENSERAEEYLGVGKLLLTGARVVKFMKKLPSLSRYEFIQQAMAEATNKAREDSLLREDVCESSYPCKPHE